MGYEQTALPWPEAEKAFVEKGILTAEEFYALAERLRGLAFTISQITSYQALVKAKTKLQQIITEGGTLADWRVWVDEQALPWTEAYAQLVHRMAVLGSYSTGRYMQMNDPDVRAEFEYLMYDAINDLRTRPEHAALDGRVWRRDEFPDEFWTPNGFGCRCEIRPLNDTMMNRLGYDTPDIERGVPVDEDGQPLHADPGFQSNQADIWTLEHLLESALRGIKTEAGR